MRDFHRRKNRDLEAIPHDWRVMLIMRGKAGGKTREYIKIFDWEIDCPSDVVNDSVDLRIVEANCSH